jgi:hypothetical protein
MSILGLGRGNRSKPAEPAPSARPPRTAAESAGPQAQQIHLGHRTLGAVDQLTGMTADEIEIVADRLIDGARETEELLRELAHRVREYGLIANERLANFVKAANGCADLARTMQARLEQRDRDEQPDVEQPSETEAAVAAPETAPVDHPDPDSVDAGIEGVAHERAPPTQPRD